MKILISFLGTGPLTKNSGSSQREYRSANYSIEGELIGASSFVASVLMDHFDYDGLYLIGTTKSMWEEAYRYFAEKNQIKFKEDVYWELADLIEEASHITNPESLDLSQVREVLGQNSNAVCIPFGLNRQEQIQIFNQLGELFSGLKNGDEIILDVTHSFRSLPLFTTSVIHYFKSLSKDIKFEKVYYGMLDAMREFNDVAPIIDISAALELQQWTTAAYSFKEYGKGKLLADLLGEKGGDIIRIFSDAVNINYLHEIQTRLTNFQTLAKTGFAHPFADWIVPDVLESFTKRLHKVGKKHYLFQNELAAWHYERENYASAYIVFVESIITFVCEQKQLDWKQMNNRNLAKELIVSDNIFELRKLYLTANKPRKNIAHNLSRRGDLLRQDIENFLKLQREFIAILRKI